MEEELRSDIPAHVAIIMDGNGRWAQKRGKQRVEGHQQGAETVEDIVTFCARSGVKFNTLYAFSMENWQRPEQEVDFLMGLLADFLDEKLKTLVENNISFRVIGRTYMLPDFVNERIALAKAETDTCSGMVLSLALSYGGREEIVDAIRSIISKKSIDPAEINVNTVKTYMQTGDIPDPDMIIRTGGEYRLSNFLLWQSSYSELFFTDTLWPDYTSEELEMMFAEFRRRERRFGRL